MVPELHDRNDIMMHYFSLKFSRIIHEQQNIMMYSLKVMRERGSVRKVLQDIQTQEI